MKALQALADRVRKAFFANTWLSFALWFAAAAAMGALLFWFLGSMSLGESQAPVYEGF